MEKLVVDGNQEPSLSSGMEEERIYQSGQSGRVQVEHQSRRESEAMVEQVREHEMRSQAETGTNFRSTQRGSSRMAPPIPPNLEVARAFRDKFSERFHGS